MSAPRFRPQAEPLEDRSTPAGLVTAGVLNGTLVVRGDDAGHAITITGVSNRSVLVSSSDSSVNGTAPGTPLFFDGITRDLVVISGDGNDTLALNAVMHRRHTALFLGAGNDGLTISGGELKGLTVTAGAGDDTVEVSGARIRGKARFNGGAGTNAVFVSGNDFERAAKYLPGQTVTFAPRPIPPPVIDTTPPSPALTSQSGESSAGATVRFTATFDEIVTGFDAADLGVTNGTISNFNESQPRVYSIEVTPTEDGAITLTLPAGVATDAAGNSNTASVQATVRSIRTDAGMTNTAPAAADPNFVDAGTGNGLKIWDTQTGSGAAVSTDTSSVQVFYTGWLASNGTEFDSARTTGSPATFDPDGLIVGFSQGLVGMEPGGIRRMFIPSALGYGAAGSGSRIPPNSDLIFEVKLVKVGE